MSVTALSHECHTSATLVTYTLSVKALSHVCHTSVTSLSYECHNIQLNAIYRTLTLANICAKGK